MAMGTETKELPDLLKDVSRSFYLTLRVLPRAVRRQIGLAYLLARTTDTIADTKIISVGQRLQALQAMRARIAHAGETSLDFGPLAAKQSSTAERALLERVNVVLDLLRTLNSGDLELVRHVLEIIVSGQELDLRRFADASSRHIAALSTDAELEDYTYRVAGCVGEFWTRICRRHLFPKAKLDDSWLLAQSVRFGRGLQLVNILRDLPTDLRSGRCYLPEEKLKAVALSAAKLLDPSNEPLLRSLYNVYLEQANDHLMAGWAYTNALPVSCVRVRLACAWPILIGLQTLKLLRTGNMLDPGQRHKISRRDVKKWIWRSVLYYPWPRAWRGLAHGQALEK